MAEVRPDQRSRVEGRAGEDGSLEVRARQVRRGSGSRGRGSRRPGSRPRGWRGSGWLPRDRAWARFAPFSVARERFAPFAVAPARFAKERFALSSRARASFARARLAVARSACVSLAPVRSAPARSALRRSACTRSLPGQVAARAGCPSALRRDLAARTRRRGVAASAAPERPTADDERNDQERVQAHGREAYPDRARRRTLDPRRRQTWSTNLLDHVRSRGVSSTRRRC